MSNAAGRDECEFEVAGYECVKLGLTMSALPDPLYEKAAGRRNNKTRFPTRNLVSMFYLRHYYTLKR